MYINVYGIPSVNLYRKLCDKMYPRREMSWTSRFVQFRWPQALDRPWRTQPACWSNPNNPPRLNIISSKYFISRISPRCSMSVMVRKIRNVFSILQKCPSRWQFAHLLQYGWSPGLWIWFMALNILIGAVALWLHISNFMNTSYSEHHHRRALFHISSHKANSSIPTHLERLNIRNLLIPHSIHNPLRRK